MLKYILSIIILMSAFFFTNAQNSVLNLDGNADYAFANDDVSLSPTDAVTVAAWVKINSNGSTSSIARKGASFTPAYSLNRESSNNFKFYVYLGSWLDSFNSTTVTNVGEWYHVAGVYNASEIMIYVNGVLESARSTTGSISTTTDNFYIGGDVGTVGVEWFNGLVDELSVWNKALTQSQIQTVMNDSLSAAYYQTSDSGLVAYWKFDELEDLGINSDGADDVRDLSVYGNHADLEGDAFIEIGGPAGVELFSTEIPDNFNLSQNYPNPFNPYTKIEYSIPEQSFVQLKVYDILGSEVATLVNQEQSAGTYRADFIADHLASGLYVARLTVEYFSKTIKMTLLR